jgi:DNA-binding transcriptional MerR regulator/methylmalonyl-CoA mutase cobalamin-binding subunit
VRSASIAEVERETGLSKDTLRVWERRYGFPTPARDLNDERVYTDDQIQRLRVIRRLLDAGLRPGKIVGLPLEQLSAVVAPARSIDATASDAVEFQKRILQLIKAHCADKLHQQLSQLLLQMGLRQFIIDVIVPLNSLVGNAWLQGTIEIFEEHLYTAQVLGLLQHALGAIPPSSLAPRVLLTTLPGEEHQLGMIMANAFFAMEGAQCISLGTQTPASDILKAVDAHGVNIVGLSSTAANSARATQAQLSALRENLDVGVELWVGGAAALDQHTIAGVRRVSSLTEIPSEVSRWRENAGALGSKGQGER